MKLIKAALGLRLSDDEWRQLEGKYGGHVTSDEDVPKSDGRKRAWGKYQKTRDQR